ncbi:MAG: polyphosphate kinase 1 [Rhodothermaceae bacterium]|nr:polyphosphate kinase 1 [Rhodothermaceae bacterium]
MEQPRLSNSPETPVVSDSSGDGAVPSVSAPVLIPKATDPQPVPEGAGLDHPNLYFNRELSWLDFNWRVFAQAMDERTPLLERVRFVAITANNLDEFYRKRVGGLKRQHAAGVRALSPDGRTPREQLDLVLGAARPMQAMLSQTWEETLRPRLAEEGGVVIRDYESLNTEQRATLNAHFRHNIFPILTPLAVDPGHPFPFISNLSLSLAVMLRHPARGTEHFARLKVPTSRGRWLEVPGEPHHFVAIEDVIRHNADVLFRGMEVEGVFAFRVTRNADVRRNEDEAEDLLSLISEELRERKFADVVRVEVEEGTPVRVRELLMHELELEPVDVIEYDGLLDLTGLFDLASLDLPALSFPDWEPIVPVRLRHQGESEDAADMFAIIRRGDLLVHHPYQSFAGSVQRFIEEASVDPQVLAIKMTLYRTSRNSPIVRALVRAAENGKQVAVLIEVKARFDEENNIEWAHQLENAGVHVTYGLVGLKTHSKTTLIVREEGEGLQTYCHIGTGNYNPSTARLYTDFGLLTCRRDIGTDLINLFHYLTGYAPEQHYDTIVIAPRDMRNRFIELIRREVKHQKANGTGRIIAKMNALDDPIIIPELYRASQAGVRIDLVVRGHCRLRPGVPGYSENIRVSSIIGRFLEHSRIFHFHNDGAPTTLIGSADWQRRNLDDRVEVVVPITDEMAQGRLIRTLAFCLEDNRLAWDLHTDGRYVQRYPEEGEPVKALHDTLMSRAVARAQHDDVPWDL